MNTTNSKIAKFFTEVYNTIEVIVNGFIQLLLNITTFAFINLTPLMAPIGPAFSIYTALTTKLSVPLYVALLASSSIELVGMFNTKVALRCYRWEQIRNKTDEPVPFKLSLIMTGLFFLIVFTLSLSIEIWHFASIFIYPGFVLVAVTAYFHLGLSSKLTMLEDEREYTMTQRDERNGLSAEIRELKKKTELAQKQYDALLSKNRANQLKLNNFQTSLDEKARQHVLWLENVINEKDKTIAKLQEDVFQLQDASIILEAATIVDHRITQLNGSTKTTPKVDDIVTDNKVKLSGLAEQLARLVLEHSDKALSLSAMADKLAVTTQELISVLTEYKGTQFVRYNDEYYAVTKQEVVK